MKETSASVPRSDIGVKPNPWRALYRVFQVVAFVALAAVQAFSVNYAHTHILCYGHNHSVFVVVFVGVMFMAVIIEFALFVGFLCALVFIGHSWLRKKAGL